MADSTKCYKCNGKGTILDDDGEDMACPSCDNTGNNQK